MTTPDVPARGLARHEVPEPLRTDVRMLGGLLGQVLRETDETLYDDVEKLRELAIRAHDEPESGALTEAEDLVAGFTLERAEQVARAFTCYFHLANLAEEYHRVRVLREREASLPPQQLAPDDSLPAAYAQLARHDPSLDVVVRRLGRQMIPTGLLFVVAGLVPAGPPATPAGRWRS